MGSPFEKLLELGFKGTEKPVADASPTRTPPGSPPLKASKTKPKRKKAAKRTALAAPSIQKQGKAKQKNAKPKARATPSFATRLPKPQLLTENGFRKAPSAALSKRPKASNNSTKSQLQANSKQAKPKLEPLAVEKTVATQIAGLSSRSMAQLQQQWLNVLAYMEKRPEHAKAWKKFHDALVAEWAHRHRVAINDPDHFVWPSTKVGPGDRSQIFANWHSEGMLGYLGYRVGLTNGATPFARRKILDAAFLAVLPPINEPSYVRDWGKEGTAGRLRRLAYEIARFAQNGKRKRSADMSSAVADWEADLRYLYREYYVGKFGFGWPDLNK